LFTVIDELNKRSLPTLLNDFQQHDEWYNTAQAVAALDDNLASATSGLETVQGLDDDKTFIPQDTSHMFFDDIPSLEHEVKSLVQINPGYSYTSFWRATLLCG
jgi:hypothetical protein